MTDKTLAERPLYEEVRDAFDGDDVVAKNIALKKAAIALDAKDAEIARLQGVIDQMKSGYRTLARSRVCLDNSPEAS